MHQGKMGYGEKSCFLRKQHTTLLLEFPNLFLQSFGSYVKLIRKAGDTHKFRCAAIDKLLCQAYIVGVQCLTAFNTIIH